MLDYGRAAPSAESWRPDHSGEEARRMHPAIQGHQLNGLVGPASHVVSALADRCASGTSCEGLCLEVLVRAANGGCGALLDEGGHVTSAVGLSAEEASEMATACRCGIRSPGQPSVLVLENRTLSYVALDIVAGPSLARTLVLATYPARVGGLDVGALVPLLPAVTLLLWTATTRARSAA